MENGLHVDLLNCNSNSCKRREEHPPEKINNNSDNEIIAELTRSLSDGTGRSYRFIYGTM